MRNDRLRAISEPSVITGIGPLSGAASGVDAFWADLLDPEARPTNARITGIDPKDHLDRRIRRHTDLFTQYALIAAQLAVADAALEIDDPERTAVVLAAINSTSTVPVLAHLDRARRGPAAVSPFVGVRSMPNAAASAIALAHGAQGATHAIASGCAAGTHAVGEAARLVQLGFADVVITGGAELFHAPPPADGATGNDGGPEGSHDADAVEAAAAIRGSLDNLKVTAGSPVSRPFSADRDGFVPADGACVLVIESRRRAEARGARIYAEVCGYGNTNEAHDLIAIRADGDGIRRAMVAALGDAGANGGDVGFVSTHGTATLANDQAEAEAVHALLGRPGPPVNSIKGRTGHSGAAAGALEAAMVALAIHHGVLPPTAGPSVIDPALDLDVVVGAPRPWAPSLALSVSAGLGGHNGCVALRPLRPD